MKHTKTLLLALLLIPLALNAIGLGVYTPIGFAEKSSATYSSNYLSTYVPDYTLDTNYKESFGVGFVFDTNVQKKRLFNYRLGIEVLERGARDRNDKPCQNGCETGTRVNAVHTFGFGIIRNENLRLWVGPRVNFAFTSNSGNDSYSTYEMEAGIAPAVGFNLVLNRRVSLSFDIDYRFADISGRTYQDESTNEGYLSGEYSGKLEGATARFYLIFKISDGFVQVAPSIEDDSL